MTNTKAILRNYLKAVNRQNDGTFGSVKAGTMKPEAHPDWDAARAYYEAGCVFGPPCAAQTTKAGCTDPANPKLVSDKGLLCRWNISQNVCQERPRDKINFQ